MSMTASHLCLAFYQLPLPSLPAPAMPSPRKRSKQLLPSAVPVFFFLLISAAAALAVLFAASERGIVGRNARTLRPRSRQLAADADADAVRQHCHDMIHADTCVSALSNVAGIAGKPLGEVIVSLLDRAAAAVRSSADNCSAYLRRPDRLSAQERLALGDCLDLFGRTLDDLDDAAADLRATGARGSAADVATVQTVLSAALTNQFTCLDGFAGVGPGVRPFIQGRIYHAAHLVSNSLAMVKRLPRRKRRRGGSGSGQPEEEAFEGYGAVSSGFPRWVNAADRRLLLDPEMAGAAAADFVVAKDGSGNFTTVADAVAAAPNNSEARFVIYIKAGGYFENVEVGKEKSNLMFVGDGMWKTVIKASRNVVDGWTTYRSATLAINGNGFLARDITVENSAGASKHQAVALRVSADFAAFYRCAFAGFQDTLYVHTLRQFYRECDVYGTIDFIFGDAAVVFQSCNLYARRPDPHQRNAFTAQGRSDPNENTGISIQKCKVAAAADLIPVEANVSTYLGRPWKEYSRTVVMESYLEGLIDPAGWLQWNGTFALDTLYYGEYMNRGPGANTTARVTWPGFRVINSSTEANNFTVASFIQGDQWLNLTAVPFLLGL